MGTAGLISVSAVVLLIAAELFCLFLCSKMKCRSYPLYIVVPVSSRDEELPQRLDCIGSLIEDGNTLIGNIFLMDIGADDKQLCQCREFCQRYHAAEIVLPGDIEGAVKKYLHSD